MTQVGDAIADLAMRIDSIGRATATSITKQNQAIIKLHGEVNVHGNLIELLTTDIAETNKKLDSLKTYYEENVKKDIDSVVSKQLKQLEDKLDLKKSAKPMGDDARSMYTGGFKKKRKTKRRKGKRKGTRKKS